MSIGNDIVALKSEGAVRAGQTKFYSKIITVPELALYCSKKFAVLPFENFVWLLWSVKEAVYKYQKRNNLTLLFSPKKIVIQHIELPLKQFAIKFGNVEFEQASMNDGDCYTCKIHSGADVFYSKSQVYDELVHTIVNHTEDFTNICWGVKYIPDTGYEEQSKSARSFVLNKLSAFFPNDNLQIAKSQIGYPVVFKNSQLLYLPLSFAHHENFVGYSFLLQ